VDAEEDLLRLQGNPMRSVGPELAPRRARSRARSRPSARRSRGNRRLPGVINDSRSSSPRLNLVSRRGDAGEDDLARRRRAPYLAREDVPSADDDAPIIRMKVQDGILRPPRPVRGGVQQRDDDGQPAPPIGMTSRMPRSAEAARISRQWREEREDDPSKIALAASDQELLTQAFTCCNGNTDRAGEGEP